MATTLLPIDPQTPPHRFNRILSISANLLPEEVVVARRARRARVWTAAVVLIVTLLCGTWFAVAYRDKQAASRDLEQATDRVNALQREQRNYSGVVELRNETTTLTDQLEAVMANDLDWGALLDTLRNAGTRSKIRVDAVTGRLNDPEAGAAPANALPGTATVTTVGTLVVTGSGPDKKAVAAYVDALAEETVVANPYVTTVATDQENTVTFSLTADITQTALCGRFTDECKPTGGK